MKTIEIEIEGKKYTVNELTVGQVESLHMLIGGFREGDIKEFWNYQVGVVSVALLPTYPEMKPEKIRTMRVGDVQTMKSIVKRIMMFSGLITEEVQPGDSQPGEAQA